MGHHHLEISEARLSPDSVRECVDLCSADGLMTRGARYRRTLPAHAGPPMTADLRLHEELADIWIVKRGPVGAWEVEEVGELGQRAVTTRLKAYPLKMPRARIRDEQRQYTSPQQYT
jgi:hypothetical protein